MKEPGYGRACHYAHVEPEAAGESNFSGVQPEQHGYPPTPRKSKADSQPIWLSPAFITNPN